MKRIFSLLLVVVLVLSAVGCTSAKGSDVSYYDIKAVLDGQTLSIDESIKYVNNTDNDIDNIRLVSYVGAFTEMGNVANESDRLAYPFGVNYAKLNIESVRVNGNVVDVKPINAMCYDVTLNKPLKVGKDINITIKYNETLPKNRLRYGYNASSINLGNAFIKVAIPYNDEYIDYKYSLNGDPFYNEIADYDVIFECDSRYKVLTTGRRKCEINGDMAIYKSSVKMVRDYAIVLSDTEKVFTDTHNGINIEYMTSKPGNATYMQVVGNAIDTFSELFGAYPYDNIAVIENDFLEGGMEYPMLIYVNNDMSEATLEKVIIHELAHQWWYGIIGVNENVDYVIDEGMAEMSTYLYYLHNGEEEYAEALMKMARDDYMTYYANGGKVNKMNIPLSDIDDLSYYIMAYVKAPLMLNKIMHEMGKTQFISSLKSVYNKYKYNIINIDKFTSEFGAHKDDMLGYVGGKDIFE